MFFNRRAAVGGWGGLLFSPPPVSLASDFMGLEEVFAAGFSPTLAFDADPLLGRAGEPSQAKVGVHACALHVHGVHCRVTAGGGVLVRQKAKMEGSRCPFYHRTQESEGRGGLRCESGSGS